VVVSDGALTDSKTFTLTVNAVDDAPVASNVSATINEDVATQVTLSYSDVESNLAATCTLSSPSNLTGTCACTSGTCQATVTGTSNFNGSASFNYTVTANGLTSNTSSASVSISAVDDAPVASNVSATINEDVATQVTLSYSDVESHQAATCTLSSPSNLTSTCACISGTCRATVTGTSNFNGAASFSYTVTANGLTSNAASATVSISAVDDAPVASNVSATINEDVATQVTLSYSDVESNLAATCTLSSPSNLTGTCTCTTGTCRATVTGTSNFNGSASFSYTVTANGLTSNAASATVSISAVDDVPVASNVSATINEDVATSVTLSYSDVESHQATACTLSSPSNLTGTCACTSGTCQATVTGTSNYNGAASFSYTVTANGLTSNTSSAAVTVSAVDDAPVASNVSGTLTEDIQGPISLSYTDVEGHVATACSLTFPTLSSLTGTCACSLGNCQASITGSSNFNGSASFSYTVTANGLVSNTASASVSVSAVNDAPVLAAISAQSTNEDTAKSVSYSFSDVDSSPNCTTSMTVTSSNTTLLPNANITKSGTAPNCSLSLSPVLNLSGTSTITVTVSDGSLTDTKTFTLTVNAVDDAPVASNVSGSLTEDTSGQVTLSYSDIESNQATTCTLSSLSNLTGSCACTSGTCQATVTGTSNFNGSASFSYTVTANGLTSNAASATVSISAVDDAPVASNVSGTLTEDTSGQITLSYSDVESNLAATCTLSSLSNLTGSCACTSGTCRATVTGTLNFNGSASFSYTVTANGLTSNTSSASVSISAVDDAPVASNVSATINEDVATQVTLSYSDIEGNQATACTLSSPSNLTGTCACTSGTCRATVTGTSNFNGSASFNYTVTANGLTSNTASGSVSISAVDDAPVASNVSATINEDVATQVTLSYSDVESHQAATCTLSSPSNLTGTCACTSGTCRATVTGTSNFNGSASFNYTVTANGLTSNTAAATITVSAVDDAPVASNVSATINEDVATQVTLSYSDVDAHQAATCTLSSPSNLTGTCACTSGTCRATVTGTSNFNGSASFNYTVTANGLTSNTASASITISAVNDTPVVSSIGTQTTNEDTSKVVSFTISDVESTLNCSSSVSVTSSSPVSSVTKGGTAPNCTLTVVPIANLNGSSSIGVTVTDGSLSASTSFTFTVAPVDDAPVASNVSGTISEDVAGSITLSYTDADSDKAATCALSSLSNLTGTCACNASTGVCTASVTGTSNYNGAASFSYTVTANSVVSNSATASVTVTAVNDAPVLGGISAQTMTAGNSLAVTLSVSDVDNSITCGSFITATSSNTTLLPNANIIRGGTAPSCTITLSPASSQSGTSTITVTASDGALSATQTFTLTVNPNIVTISQFSTYRGWSNGTFARTCYEYRYPTAPYQYSGATGNSTATTSTFYRIDPDGAGAIAPLDVSCDMTNGGWTSLNNALITTTSTGYARNGVVNTASDLVVPAQQSVYSAIAALSTLQRLDYAVTFDGNRYVYSCPANNLNIVGIKRYGCFPDDYDPWGYGQIWINGIPGYNLWDSVGFSFDNPYCGTIYQDPWAGGSFQTYPFDVYAYGTASTGPDPYSPGGWSCFGISLSGYYCRSAYISDGRFYDNLGSCGFTLSNSGYSIGHLNPGESYFWDSWQSSSIKTAPTKTYEAQDCSLTMRFSNLSNQVIHTPVTNQTGSIASNSLTFSLLVNGPVRKMQTQTNCSSYGANLSGGAQFTNATTSFRSGAFDTVSLATYNTLKANFVNCGQSQQPFSAKVTNCAQINNGATVDVGGGKIWKLVTKSGANELWMDDSNGMVWSPYQGGMNWDNAMSRCQNLHTTAPNSNYGISGETWILPSTSIIDAGRANGVRNLMTNATNWWSSTQYNGLYSYKFSFYISEWSYFYKTDTEIGVYCVFSSRD
jgi:redox-sensitive bicupin YhaK (pirin superfamily)